ncbi:MAG: uroporphyrinogen decarboxylase family protein [Promethearchaeota archaeon]
MSPRANKHFFVPVVKQVIDYCHEHGVHFMMHSCGDVREFMPILVDLGLDAFQFDAPDQTGIEWCGEHFGGKVAFMDVVDIQSVLPAGRGQLEDIKAYVRKMIHHLGRFDGGLIGQEYPTPKVLNAHKYAYKTMRASFKKHGKYPLNVS